MFCPKCGNEMMSDEAICPECGCAIRSQEPADAPSKVSGSESDSISAASSGQTLDAPQTVEQTTRVFVTDGTECPKCGSPVLVKTGTKYDIAEIVADIVIWFVFLIIGGFLPLGMVRNSIVIASFIPLVVLLVRYATGKLKLNVWRCNECGNEFTAKQ